MGDDFFMIFVVAATAAAMTGLYYLVCFLFGTGEKARLKESDDEWIKSRMNLKNNMTSSSSYEHCLKVTFNNGQFTIWRTIRDRDLGKYACYRDFLVWMFRKPHEEHFLMESSNNSRILVRSQIQSVEFFSRRCK